MNIDLMSKEYNLSPIVCQLLEGRGIKTKEQIDDFLNPNDKCFYDPFLLKGMRSLVERIKTAMQKKEKVLIFGDYDVDGVSATAILVKYFASQDFYVDYFLPNRYVDGYGLTFATIDMLKQKFSPDLIITVDCGIACYQEVEYAKSLGIEIAVTDHHDIPEVIPKGIVVDPKLEGQGYPFKYLCGTGVAFKIVQALSGIENAKKYLGICSIATIADIVPLQDENRAIVKLGMKDFGVNLPLGIKMLFAQTKLNLNASATDIAFRLAPKINAAGRMGDASVALKLYIKNDKILLKNTIDKIEQMNIERQTLCTKVYDDAVEMLSNINISNYNSIVLFSKNWDSGILGIVASKIANEYNRPTVLFSEKDGLLKGSARSINDIDIFRAISSMKEVLETFGGHKMAAGLTIKKVNFNNFLTSLNDFIGKNYAPKDFLPTSKFDLEVDASQINLKLVKDLEVLEPCGCGNSKPIFDIKLGEGSTFATMPNHPSHITIQAKNLNIIAFNSYKYLQLLKSTTNRHIQIELQENSFKGKKSVKGIAKNISTGEIAKLKDNDFLKGIYLKQMSYSEKKKKVTLYNSQNIKDMLLQAKNDSFGWLFVCSSFNTYKSFCEISKSNNLQHFMYEIISNSGVNAVILAPDGFKNFGAYKNIIYVDSVLSEGYLGYCANLTNARLFVPKDKQVDRGIFSGLSTDRGVFAKYFKLLSNFASKQSSFVNDVDLFKNLYIMDKKITFKQFIFCLYTFVELNIFEISNELDMHCLLENKKVFKSLTLSNFYNKVAFATKVV